MDSERKEGPTVCWCVVMRPGYSLQHLWGYILGGTIALYCALSGALLLILLLTS